VSTITIAWWFWGVAESTAGPEGREGLTAEEPKNAKGLKFFMFRMSELLRINENLAFTS
jgi:hypothetical protein